MSMTAVQWAFDQHIEQPTLKLLLVTLAWHHNNDTEQCNPGIDRLVTLSGLSRSTVFRALTGLLGLGLISYNRAQGSSNSYILHLDKALPKPMQERYRKTAIPQALARKVMERDAYRCRHCETHLDLCCDHIVPEISGGLTVYDNLQTLCRSCNSKKGKSHCETEKSQLGSHSDTQKVNQKEKKQAGRTQLSAMTADWQADADLWKWAHDSFPALTREDLTHETDRFRDHWISKAERRADWRASWRNWIRNAAKFAARSRPAHRLDRVRETNAERIDAAMARHGVSPAPGRSHLRLIADRDSGH